MERQPPEGGPGLRVYCLACDASLVDAELYHEFRVCPSCRFHYSLAARERISLLADPGTFQETHRAVSSLAPLSFSSRVPRQQRTGLTEAAVIGRCAIGDRPAVIIVLDFGFLGGTMGGVVGEKVSLAFEMAAKRKLPVVAVITSGGAAIQEGILSLMQMAKTSFAVNALGQERLPFIAVMANPTTGQVYSSFANLADVILAEPGALMGFAPLNVLTGSSMKSLPPGVQTSETHLEHGMIDRVVDREHLREVLSVLLDLLSPQYTLTTRGKVKETVVLRSEDRQPAWETVQVARHRQRPTSLDYIRRTFFDFVELHGDRLQGDDPSIIAGLGFLGSQGVAVIGQERIRGRTSAERNRGRMKPEGFRKAQRIMRLASKLQIPLITLVDTTGPYYDPRSEERGLGNAIATTMALMSQLPIPTVSVVIGEGGSEAALALAVADRTLMLQNAIYSVSSAEDAASVLDRDPTEAREIAESLKLTAQECQDLGIIDLIVPEPSEGAHRNPDEVARRLKRVLEAEMAALNGRSTGRVLKDRYKKFRKMGEYNSHFRDAVTREVTQLQGYVTKGVKRIRRRRRRGESPQLEQGDKEE